MCCDDEALAANSSKAVLNADQPFMCLLQVIGDGVQVVVNGLRLRLWPPHSEE